MAIDAAIAKLPIAKVMTYQLADGWSSVRFVRPAHGLVALHGTDVVPVKVLGLEARNTTQGHRFMSSGMIRIREADSYAEQLLNEGKVIANFCRAAGVHSEAIGIVQSKQRKRRDHPPGCVAGRSNCAG